jgi:septum formation protein
MTATSLWMSPQALVLASASQARLAMLAAAGLPVIADPARIDERAVETALPGSCTPAGIAQALALAKAKDVAPRHPAAIVLGADQTLAHAGHVLHKPENMDAARDQLAAMAGQTHTLNSAFALVRGSEVLATGVATATLTMRKITRRDLDRYLTIAGPDILSSVGAYQLERLGVHLFDAIEGDHFTILGLPMLQLLAALRSIDMLA